LKQIVFITATNTDVGKSYAAEVFLNKYAKEGKKVGYFKPIETGVETTPLDGSHLLDITKKLNNDFKFSVHDIVPYQFKLPASPFVAKGNTVIDSELILTQAKKLLNYCDVLVVEGAGGLMVPIEKDFFMIDLIKLFQEKLNSKTVLISPSNLGSINDTLLSQKALVSQNIDYDWYINLHKDKDKDKDSFETITLPFYKEYFNEIFYLK